MLKASNPHNISIPKDIRNAVNAVKCDKLGELTNAEAAVEKLGSCAALIVSRARREQELD